MADAAELVRAMKKAAMDAVNEGKPAGVCCGKVDIEVSHFTVNDDFMIPEHTHNTPAGITDSGNLDTTHKHRYKGRKKILVYNGLKTGEKVLLVRFVGGQRFVVLDRVSEHIVNGEWLD